MSPSLGVGRSAPRYLPADGGEGRAPGSRSSVAGERIPAEVVRRPFWTNGSVKK